MGQFLLIIFQFLSLINRLIMIGYVILLVILPKNDKKKKKENH